MNLHICDRCTAIINWEAIVWDGDYTFCSETCKEEHNRIYGNTGLSNRPVHERKHESNSVPQFGL